MATYCYRAFQYIKSAPSPVTTAQVAICVGITERAAYAACRHLAVLGKVSNVHPKKRGPGSGQLWTAIHGAIVFQETRGAAKRSRENLRLGPAVSAARKKDTVSGKPRKRVPEDMTDLPIRVPECALERAWR